MDVYFVYVRLQPFKKKSLTNLNNVINDINKLKQRTNEKEKKTIKI